MAHELGPGHANPPGLPLDQPNRDGGHGDRLAVEMIRAIVLHEGWRGDDADAMVKSVIRRRDALNANGGKSCTHCYTHKGVSAYEVDPTGHDGLSRRCVDCEA